jgi:putative oxidoreductase
MMHKLMHNRVMVELRKKCSADIGLLVLRTAAGAIFMYHGYPKLFGGTAMVAKFFASIGIPLAGFFAPFVGVVEFFGGLMLILGLGTRFWGLGLAIDMAVAILAAKGLSSWKGIEFELILMASSLQLLLTGAGDYSLDAWLMKRGSKEHDAAMPMAAKAPPKA